MPDKELYHIDILVNRNVSAYIETLATSIEEAEGLARNNITFKAKKAYKKE